MSVPAEFPVTPAVSTAARGDLLSTNNLSDLSDAPLGFANIKQAATEEATGVVELATAAEATAGTDTERAVTPAGVKAVVDLLDATSFGLGNVENVALSTWAGSAALTTLGTIATGVWNATAIGLDKVAQGGATSGQVLAWNGTVWAPLSLSSSATVAFTRQASAPATPADGFTQYANASDNPTWLLPSGFKVIWNVGTVAADTTLTIPTTGTVLTDAASLNADNLLSGTTTVARGGTGQTTYTNGQLLIGNTTGNTLTKATLTAGTGISITNGTGSITIAATTTPKLIQSVQAQTTTYDSTTTAIPNDDTIPQNTEGKEALTVTITPTSTSNKIRITGTVHVARSTGNGIYVALFRDSGADAIAVFAVQSGAVTGMTTIPIDFTEVAPSTSAITYKIRYGSPSGTTCLNGSSTTRWFGGTAITTLTAQEIA